MKISARNVIKGTVKQLNVGAVNVELVLEIAPEIEITSIITKGSADSMELAVGKEAYVIVKASNVMVGVD